MTTMAYPITLLDNDIIVVESALKLLIKECDRKIKDGESVPYYIYKVKAKQIIKNLYNSPFLASGNTLLTPPDINVIKGKQVPKISTDLQK